MTTKKKAKKKTIRAWYFCADDRKLRYNDGRTVVEGETHTHDGPIAMCESGLHASRRLIGALRYAPGPVICRVECGGTIIEGKDKLVCTSRKYLHVVNIERELHEFAIWCAERALKRTKNKDERCWNALKVKRLWLDGKATDAELAAAWSAAEAAAWDAAWSAAWSAARGARNRKLTRIVNAKIKKSIDAGQGRS